MWPMFTFSVRFYIAGKNFCSQGNSLKRKEEEEKILRNCTTKFQLNLFFSHGFSHNQSKMVSNNEELSMVF